MAILEASFQSLNYSGSSAPLPTEPNISFQITAKSDTDIWRRPPSTEVFTAPIAYQKLEDVSSFKSVRVTFTLCSSFSTLYDQAGIVVRFPQNDHWIKAGLEISSKEGTKSLSTVAAGKWADWSLYPYDAQFGDEVTIQLKKEDEHGIWVYYVDKEGKEIPLREITWAFAGEGEGKGVEIGAYCCRPSKKLNPEDFTVDFKGFQVTVV